MTVEELVVRLKDTDAHVRRGAAWALGGIVGRHDEAAIAALTAALADEDEGVRVLVVRALVLARSPDATMKAEATAVEQWINESRFPDAHARRRAAWALGGRFARTNEAAIAALTAALDDPDGIVCFLAARSLAHAGASAVPALLKALADRDPDVRRRGANALGRIGPAATAAVPALAKLAVGDADSTIRDWASWAIEAVIGRY